MNNSKNVAQPTSGKLVVVLGMHRSGTSAITRAMVALGAELGDRLLPPLAGVNDKGFFEDYDVFQINHELLEAGGAQWHTVGDVGLNRIAPAKLDAFRQRAADTLRAKCAGRTFALKDPRLARLMPFWQPVFEQIGLQVAYVIAVRNPISVMRSLKKRDNMSEEQAYALWLAHVVPSLLETKGKLRAFVDYDRMLDDPAGELSRLANRLKMPIDAARADEFARSFLAEDLRHTRFSAADLSDVSAAPSIVKPLYAALETVCRTGEEDSALRDALESGRQFLADIEPLLRVYQNASLLNAMLEAAKKAILERDKRIADLQQQLATRPVLAQASAGSPIVAAAMAAAAAKNGAAPQPAAATGSIAPAAARRGRTIFSFIVDADPKFAYEGYHLARSLIQHSCDHAADVNVQFTKEVGAETRDLFRKLGCTLHDIERFGDGRYCNKIAQLVNLHQFDFDHVVLLDTDMIAIADLRPFLSEDALLAKVVDFPQPPLPVLEEIGRAAGFHKMPPVGTVDAGHAPTFAGNCNGGFYSIPKALAEIVDRSWRRWAQWLLDNKEPLVRNNMAQHVDQVSMWLAIVMDRIPYRAAPSNVNYYVHMNGEHRYFDAGAGIALLHYHDSSLNVLGKLEPQAQLNELERRAVDVANQQIGTGFENTTFWNLRYAHFPERGSGVGSRGENLRYKRELLVQQGIESAESVLDIGCGDLEMIKGLAIQNYLGLDTSREALQMARRARPDWEFLHIDVSRPQPVLTPRQMAVCFEVLIHQPTETDYRKLIDFLARSTAGTLIVSGYVGDYDERKRNSMVYFYEPLDESLRKTGKFSSIQRIGSHSDVAVLRCDV
ncbi:hypothetical protein [Paraburkholderia rhizosphaerae]|uniref:Methyltransferase domain-containing protein n=1 Tax=Paraburkholderia rhizosphaerae TaxID=480658 RepID=A0A4R8LVT2_9BURK|nr:hypothetical protein [Paraburkholderia rhizosphaerae]TDY51854.1 hypothetical protein BX592_106150 [Paraburkholderia rhizosphaerae]